MIVPMKKVVLICQEQKTNQSLKALQQAGLVHLAPVSQGSDQDLDQAEQEVQRLQHILGAVDHNLELTEPGAPPASASEAAPLAWKALQELRTILDRRQKLKQEYQRIQPFGPFDPQSIHQLSKHGVLVKLYSAPHTHSLTPPGEAVLIQISADRDRLYLALISREEVSLSAQEVPLPAQGLQAIEQELSDLSEREERARQSLAACARYREHIQALLAQAQDTLLRLRAKAGMHTSGPVAALQGYVPEKALPQVSELAAANGWGYQVADPSFEDHPPTLIHLPAWIRPIQAVFKLINIVPHYRESDISAPFLLFLSIFFAMIIGDAGYGALFLGLSLIFRSYVQRVSPHIFPFLLINSTATVIWGLATGNVFGHQALATPFDPLQVAWLSGPEADSHLMFLCFLLGAIHLSLAHLWRLILLWPSPKVLAQAGWILITWVMFYAARSLVLMQDFPHPMLAVLGGGFLLIVVFMRPWRQAKSQWTDYVRLPLDLISQFVDVVSYVRLFAVGTATVAVAQAFNQMALSLGFGGLLQGLGAALILFLGHSMNIALAGMGVLVHGVRLNTLEFASHAGITWSGTQYQPFASQTTAPSPQQ